MVETEPVRCPDCTKASELPTNGVSVCPACGRSLYVRDGYAIRALAQHLSLLPIDELNALRRQRGAIVRPKP